MADDIVKQLRDSACGNNCRCPYCNRNKAAAHEIERLRTELATLGELQLQIDYAKLRESFC